MKITRKTYQAISACSMTINVTRKSGKQEIIDFSSHNIELDIKGKYSTVDPEVIALLEASEAFNQNYKLISTIEEESSAPEGKVVNTPEGDDSLTLVPDCGTVQLAKAYLIEHFSEKVTPSSLTTWAAVDAAGKEQGIKFR